MPFCTLTLATQPGSGGLNYDGASAAQILSNLVNAFSSVDPAKDGTKNEEYVKTYSSPLLEARKGLLSIMPRIISGKASFGCSYSSLLSPVVSTSLNEILSFLPRLQVWHCCGIPYRITLTLGGRLGGKRTDATQTAWVSAWP